MIRHIDSELQSLKDLALQMGSYAERAVEGACQCVRGADSASYFREVNLLEGRINDLQMVIDEACVSVLAKQAPVAKDLRLVFAVSKINTDLERIGDESVNIARNACELLESWPNTVVPPQLPEMMDEVKSMVGSVLDAFSRRDVTLSQKVLQQDDCVDGLRDTLLEEMTRRMKLGSDQVEVGLALMMIAKNLERVADHATNIAEEVIYFATGNDVRHGHRLIVNSRS